MTKKDYVLIAKTLAIYNRATSSFNYKVNGYALMSEVSMSLAEALKKDNERFDIDKFLQACEIGNSLV